MRSDVSKINEKTPYEELTEGLIMFAGGTAKEFETGPWRTMTPVFIKEKCKQCLLCAPVCPDGCIPVSDSKR
nr:4Fe-4S binding protein [Lachnospiraceae bacterium]